MVSRERLIFAAKLVLVLLAFGYLFYGGGLRVDQLRIRGDAWGLIGLSAALTFLVVILSAIRYWLLARVLEIRMTFGAGLRIGMITAFFNTVLLGGVGGDVVRGGMLMRRAPAATAVLASIGVDRLIGLLGLCMMGGLALLLARSELAGATQLRGLVTAISGILMFAASVGVAGLITLLVGWQRALWWVGLAALGLLGLAWLRSGLAVADRGVLSFGALTAIATVVITPRLLPDGAWFSWLQRLPMGGALTGLMDYTLQYRRHAGTIVAALLLSIVLHLSTIGALYLVGHSMPTEAAPQFWQILIAAPPTMVANSLPVPGGGLGVGEGSMEALLRATASGGAVVTLGAELFLIHRIISNLVRLVGLPLYLWRPRDAAAMPA